MSPEGTAKTEKLEAEVVIIGGGAAGLSAALTAIEKGATSVIVLEKRLNVGGNTSRAHHIFAAESHIQRRALVDASRDVLFKIAMKWHHYSRVNPRILRAYINKSADTIRWLEEKGKETTVYKVLSLAGVTGGGAPAAVDVKDGKIVRVRPLHYDSKYTREEINPWKFERNGKTLGPSMKSLPSPFSLAYKKRAYSPNPL